MVKSTVKESLDEAFEQRLVITDEPWHAAAESRMSRRDQHALRHGQRRPSSEVRNIIKPRKPLPENKQECYRYEHVTNSEVRGILGPSVTSPIRFEQEAYPAKDWKQHFYLDGTPFDDQDDTRIQHRSDLSTCQQVATICGQSSSSDPSCPHDDHVWAPTVDRLTRRHPNPTLGGNRHGDRSYLILDVDGHVLKHPGDSSTNRAQKQKRKISDTSKIVADTNKRIRNIGCKVTDTRQRDVINEDKNRVKRQREHSGEGHFAVKRQRPQLWLGQTKNEEFDAMTEDDIHVVVDSMTAMLSSLHEPQTHSYQFKRTLVNPARQLVRQ